MADFSHLTKTGQGQMVDVSQKATTLRTASAEGKVWINSICRDKLTPIEAAEICRTARIAGTLAAKKTAEWIPYCHPLSLDKVDAEISFDAEKSFFSVVMTTRTRGVTGVEMEALTAVSAACLTIFDMVKAVDPQAWIGDIRVIRKEGGKHGVQDYGHSNTSHIQGNKAHKNPDSVEICAAIIVCSDRAHQGIYEDKSGALCLKLLSEWGYVFSPTPTPSPHVISDDPQALKQSIEDLLCSSGPDLIFISGGTGLGPRDNTPQALDALADYQIPGVGEYLRRESLKHTSKAFLSRCGGWVKNQTLILALPGSEKAVSEQLYILKPHLPSLVKALKNECHHNHQK